MINRRVFSLDNICLPLFGRPQRIDVTKKPGAETAQLVPGIRKASSRLCSFSLPVIVLIAAMQSAFATTYIHYDGVLTQLATGANSTPGVTGPAGVAVDLTGNLYVADAGGNRIVEVAANGTTSVLSITGLSTSLSNPAALAVDSAGNLYIADSGNNRIVKVSPTGSGSVINTGSFTLNHPRDVAVDIYGDMFIADTSNNRIIEIPSSGPANASVVAPTSGLSFTSSPLSGPEGLAVDTYGNLYIVDSSNNRLVEITTAGVGSAILSFGSQPLSNPSFVAVSRAGKIYITDTGNARVATMDAAGNQIDLLQDDMNSSLGTPTGIAVSATGEIYIADISHNLVNAFYEQSAGFGHVQLGSSGTPLTLNFKVGGSVTLTGVAIYTTGIQSLDYTIAANSGTPCTTGSTGILCTVNVQFTPTAPGLRRGALVLSYATGAFTVPLWGIADAPVPALSPGVASAVSTGATTTPNPFQSVIDGAGNIYVVSYAGSKVVKIPAGGGTAATVSTGSLTLDNPTGIAMDGAGNLFVSDYGNARIVEIPASGTASVLTINGISPNGPLPALSFPTYLNFDAAGNLWITDYGNGRFVIVSPPAAGTGSTGDGTVANGIGSVAATGIYTFPGVDVTATALDAAGNFYIADRAPTSPTQPRVVKIDPFGLGSQVSLPSLTLSNPQGITLDPSGNIYVLDSGHDRIIQQTTNGTTSVMSFSGATIGAFAYGITTDPLGNVFVSDFSNGRLLEVNVNQATLSFPSTTVNTQSSTLTATVTNMGDQNLAFSAISYTSYFKHDTTDVSSCTATTSLTPGTSCDVPAFFAPTAVGPYSQYITFTSNALNTIPTIGYIGVQGTGTAPPASTTTAVTFSPTSPVFGQSVTVTATVSSTSTATGMVTFTDQTTSSTIASNVALSSGVATTMTSTLAVGSHSIQAAYTPAGNFLSSNGSNTVTVSKASTSTSVAFVNGTLTATVTATAPGAGTPTGSVGFLNGSTVIGGGTLSGGTATLAVSLTPPYSLTAAYSGDANFTSSTSGALTNTTTTVTASASSAIYGQSLTFTATVSAAAGTPTGTVTFTDLTTSTTLSSNATLSAGVATIMTSTLGVGSHTILAVYFPSGGFQPSNGSTGVITITKAGTSTSLTLSGSTLMATVTAMAPSSGTPTGTVQFLNNGTAIGTGTLSGGTATMTMTTLALTANSYSAVYSGDANFTTSTSSASTQSPMAPGIFRSSNGLWMLDSNFNNTFDSGDTVTTFAGNGLTPQSTDIAVAGDWNGNGITKIGLYRPLTGTWFLDYNGNGVYDGPSIDRQYQYGGIAGDIPVVGDWTGSGATKVGIFRQGGFFLLNTTGTGMFSSNDAFFAFGGLTGCTGSLPGVYKQEPAGSCDIPVVGDWNQSGTAKVGIVRAAPGTSQPFLWILDTTGAQAYIASGPQASTSFAFGGIQGDLPLMGHWTNSGKTNIGVFRSGFLWVEDTTAGLPSIPAAGDTLVSFPYGGIPGDQPVVGHWQ